MKEILALLAKQKAFQHVLIVVTCYQQ